MKRGKVSAGSRLGKKPIVGLRSKGDEEHGVQPSSRVPRKRATHSDASSELKEARAAGVSTYDSRLGAYRRRRIPPLRPARDASGLRRAPHCLVRGTIAPRRSECTSRTPQGPRVARALEEPRSSPISPFIPLTTSGASRHRDRIPWSRRSVTAATGDIRRAGCPSPCFGPTSRNSVGGFVETRWRSSGVSISTGTSRTIR
jgi:hypothetical protein